jgi:hypothetical protein
MRASSEWGGRALLQCSQIGPEFQHGVSLRVESLKISPVWLFSSISVSDADS